jgi:chromosome segregation ATPase
MNNKKVIRLEHNIEEMIQKLSNKDKELKEKHIHFLESNKKMTQMKDEINALSLTNKRLERQLEITKDKTKAMLEKFKSKIKTLQEGSVKILDQLVPRV